MSVLYFLSLISKAQAQECTEPGYDPEFPFPDECCEAVPVPHVCAIQAVASDEGATAAWLGEDSSVQNWRARKRANWYTANISEQDLIGDDIEPDVQNFVAPSLSASGGGSSNLLEVSCGVQTTGKIACWGGPANAVTGRPTGTDFVWTPAVGTPFGVLAHARFETSGPTVTFGALSNTGAIYVWGNLPGSFAANKPTSTGWESLSIGGMSSGSSFGCVSKAAGPGITCWKSSTGAMVIPDNAPTTGTYKHVAVSRNFAIGVKTDGTAHLWGDTVVSPNLIAAYNAAPHHSSPVVSAAVFGNTGDSNGLLYHEDKTITLLVDPDVVSTNTDLIDTAPCYDPPGTSLGTCPTTAQLSVWHSAISFRTRPELSQTAVPGQVCGVVHYDPDMNYSPGAVICWGAKYSLATFAPAVIDDSCTIDQQWWLDEVDRYEGAIGIRP